MGDLHRGMISTVPFRRWKYPYASYPEDGDPLYMLASHSQFLAMAYGVKIWNLTTTLNAAPVSTRLVAMRFGTDTDPAENEYQIQSNLSSDYARSVKWACEDLLEAPEDPRGDPQRFAVEFGVEAVSIAFFWDALGTATLVEAVPQRTRLLTEGNQPLAVVNGTALDKEITDPTVGFRNIVLTVRAYGNEFTFDTGFGHMFDLDDGADPDNSLTEVIMEADTYWAYGGRWDTSTGLPAT